MSHHPLKIDGGRRFILRNIRGLAGGVRSKKSSIKRGNQQGHRTISFDPEKLLLCLDQSGDPPTKGDNSTPSTFDVLGKIFRRTLRVLDDVG